MPKQTSNVEEIVKEAFLDHPIKFNTDGKGNSKERVLLTEEELTKVITQHTEAIRAEERGRMQTIYTKLRNREVVSDWEEGYVNGLADFKDKIFTPNTKDLQVNK